MDHSASRVAPLKLATARREVLAAHRRLNDFLERGIVPEDLKLDLVDTLDRREGTQ
jgi:hypothetical protein